MSDIVEEIKNSVISQSISPNEQHLKKLSEMVANFNDDEAYRIAEKLVENHPDIVLEAIKNRLGTLNTVISDIKKGVKGI